MSHLVQHIFSVTDVVIEIDDEDLIGRVDLEPVLEEYMVHPYP